MSEQKSKVMIRTDSLTGAKPSLASSGTGRVLTLAIASTLAMSVPSAVKAQMFPAEINLADLNGQNGFRMNGQAQDDRSGFSVSGAGDINGDGIDDLIIGAPGADPNGESSGRSYVVFGGATWPAFFSLGGLTTSPDLFPGQVPGFRIEGEFEGDRSGISVSSAGDINGDGVDDLIIGARGHDGFIGRGYVLFGSPDKFPSTFELSSINGSNGFDIQAEVAVGLLGDSVDSAGDINGDGVDDLIIGAPYANVNSLTKAGRSYVVFGSSNPLGTPIDLASLDGSNGFRMNGQGNSDESGYSVSAAGDINGDGVDDLIVGARVANRGYVVFGGTTWRAFFSLGGLTTSPDLFPGQVPGFVIEGESADDLAGLSVSAAGDVNADGIDDLIIGAPNADFNGTNSGRAYVVFGASSGLPSVFELAGLDGSNGFALNGEAQLDRAGGSVGTAGDINGDGIDDLIIGATLANSNGNIRSGRTYVVFGSSDPWPQSINLSTLDGTNGFAVNGESADDESGRSVSAAADINGDGVDDLVIGAPDAEWNNFQSAGRSYVVFGRSDQLFSDQFAND